MEAIHTGTGAKVPEDLRLPVSMADRRRVAPVGACKYCSSPYIEEEYEFPLCWDCRLRLSRREIPHGIKLICTLVLMAIIYAGTYYPDVLRATVAYQDGRNAERSQNFARAIQEYETVLVTYPDSPLALAHLGISYYHSGNVLQAVWILGGF
jgi:hypothetical protein